MNRTSAASKIPIDGEHWCARTGSTCTVLASTRVHNMRSICYLRAKFQDRLLGLLGNCARVIPVSPGTVQLPNRNPRPPVREPPSSPDPDLLQYHQHSLLQ